MGTIKKKTLKDGSIRYAVEVTVVGPDKRARRRRKTFKTKRDAQAWEREIDQKLRATGAADTSRMIWSSLIDAYVDHPEGLASLAEGKTQTNRVARLDWWKDEVGAIALEALHPTQVDAAIVRYRRRGLKGRPVSDKTCNKVLAALGAVWKWAEPRYGLRRSDCPTAGLRSRESSGLVRWLDRDEVKILTEETVAEGHVDLELLIRLGLTTGHRRTPLVRLEWSWIDFADATIELPPRVTKNSEPLFLHLADSVAEMLRDRVRALHHPYVLEPVGKYQRPRFPRKRFDAVRERCMARGMEHFSFHTLRHTWASRMAAAGMSLPEIANGLGNTEAAAKIYSHFQKKATVRKAAKILSESGLD